MPVRFIVGAGTAAAVFLQTIGNDGYTNYVVGSDGLWEQLPDHPMGQPAHLLHLPGQLVPSYRTPSGGSEEGLGKFLTSHQYQQGVRAIVGQHAYRYRRGVRAQRIRKSRNVAEQLVVELSDGRALRADQIILATGIGPQRDPPTVEGDPRVIPGDFSPIIEGIQFLANWREQTPWISRGIYGGGATAAWVAAAALQTSRKLCWFARPGGSAFSGSDLPGIRNDWVLRFTEERGLRRLEAIEKVEVAYHAKHSKMRLKLHIKDSPRRYWADQFIYALGGDTDGGKFGSIKSMVADDLFGELEPFMDQNGALGAIGAGTLAWATPSKSLMIVGAAAYNFADPHKPRVRAPMSDLPWNAQVPDGIAMITASVSALNSYIPIEQEESRRRGWKEGDWLDVRITRNTTNINLADRNQLAVLFTLMFDEWPARNINTLVERVVAWRSETAVAKDSHIVFGITPTEFHVLVDSHGPREMTARELQDRFRLVGIELQ